MTESLAPDWTVPENVSPFKPLPILVRCVDCGNPLDWFERFSEIRDGRLVEPLCLVHDD